MRYNKLEVILSSKNRLTCQNGKRYSIQLFRGLLNFRDKKLNLNGLPANPSGNQNKNIDKSNFDH